LSGREDDDRNRGNQEVGMNGFGGLFDGKKMQEIASLREAIKMS
jgi:hypothetical protein